MRVPQLIGRLEELLSKVAVLYTREANADSPSPALLNDLKNVPQLAVARSALVPVSRRLPELAARNTTSPAGKSDAGSSAAAS
jgi:hypothetical protein